MGRTAALCLGDIPCSLPTQPEEQKERGWGKAGEQLLSDFQRNRHLSERPRQEHSKGKEGRRKGRRDGRKGEGRMGGRMEGQRRWREGRRERRKKRN